MKYTLRTTVSILSIFIILSFFLSSSVCAEEFEEPETLYEEMAAVSYADGIYTISSALSSGKVVDISGASKANKANVQLYQANGTDAQNFRLVNNGDGTVTFLNVNSGKALDVYGGKKAAGTNVHQYTSNGTKAQKWILQNAGGGYVRIASALGGSLVLDVRAGKTANKTNIWVYTANSSNAQKFKLSAADTDAGIEDGTYLIESKLAAGFVADIKGASKKDGANCQVYKSNGTAAQKYRIRSAGSGIYTIINANSGMALAVLSDGNVVQKTANDSAAQQWKIRLCSDGYLRFVNVGNGLSLDVYAGKCKNGTTLHTYANNGSDAQRFRLIETTEPGHVVEIDPGHQRYGDSSLEPNAPGSSTMKAKVTSGTQGISTGIEEYELNLNVSLKLKAELESRGYTVFMTRETHDVRISNVERAQKAAADGAEIFIRIHADGEDNSTSMYGVHGYAPGSDNPYLSSDLIYESQRLSGLLCNYQCAATGQRNLGLLYDNNMTGINWATMPVTIVEMGYMSNPSEDVYINTDSNQYTIAYGIANGVDAYFDGETP